MRRTRTVLASGFLALVLITASSARSVADDCLAKPNGPTPQGQHWYFRIDHASNGRQCWYLKTEGARAQKTSRQKEGDSSGAMAQAVAAPPVPATEVPPEENAAVAVPPIPWLNVQKLPEPVPFIQPATQKKPPTQTQADAPSGNASTEGATDPPVAVPSRPAPSAENNLPSAPRSREPQRRSPAQVRPEPPAPAIAHIDHTFTLLMVMLAALAIAGPALHFVERRRRREAVNFRPPPWARVVALNAPTPRIHMTMSRPKIAKPVAPMPITPPDQTERLAHALQQLVDRLQTVDEPEPKPIRIRPRGRASM